MCAGVSGAIFEVLESASPMTGKISENPEKEGTEKGNQGNQGNQGRRLVRITSSS
jgi:hypothetical protein